MTKILVGADPELFVKQNGKHVSGFGLIPGDKAQPHVVECGAVQVDGMALEFNIDPAASEKEFITNLDTVMGILKQMVPDHEVVADPVAHFTKEYMAKQPFKALELGCDPDFNGWTGKENKKPDVDLPFRTGAGHVHIGIVENANTEDKAYMDVCCAATREMDLFLALPSLFYDNDTQRREMYGKAGAFRPKSYGFEYRTLSNRWLSDKAIMSWVYRATQQCIAGFLKGDRKADHYAKTTDIQEIINKSNKREARKIIKDAGLLMPVGA